MLGEALSRRNCGTPVSSCPSTSSGPGSSSLLQSTVRAAYENVPHYRAALDSVGFSAGRSEVAGRT